MMYITGSTVADMSNSTDQVLKIEVCRRGNYRNVPQMVKISTTCFPVTTLRRRKSDNQRSKFTQSLAALF